MSNIRYYFLFITTIGCGIIVFSIFTQDFGHTNRRNLRELLEEKKLQYFGGLEGSEIPSLKDHVHAIPRRVAEMHDQVRVCCWVMTSRVRSSITKKAIPIYETWGKRCNRIWFMSDQPEPKDRGIPIVGLNNTSGRAHLTAKSMKAFQYIYDNHYNECDWVLKADDDTYVVVENLRYFLHGLNKSQALFAGHHFNVISPSKRKYPYTSGGAGYVISQEALRRFGQRTRRVRCAKDGGPEDIQVSNCLLALGVILVDSRDSYNRSRFHCFPPNAHIKGKYPSWYYRYDNYGGQGGQPSLSDYAISFHYVDPRTMVLIDYLIYHLRPYGHFENDEEVNRLDHDIQRFSKA